MTLHAVVPPSTYMISGGRTGRERLRVLSSALADTTGALLDRVGIAPDAHCLDVGCGGGDVTAMLAARVPAGRVVGTDLDPLKITLALEDAPPGVELRVEGIGTTVLTEERFDVVYARFLLSHLAGPGRWVRELTDLLVPGGVLVVEDVRIEGAFCSPPSAAFQRALEIYVATARANGGDPELGPKLPRLLRAAGLADIGIEVVQPTAFTGPAKEIQLLTLQAIRASAVAAGVTSEAELEAVVHGLAELVARPDTVVSTAQIVQTWGRRAA